MTTYGNLKIPNVQITTRGAGSVNISSVAFNPSVALIGGYDAANGTATAGEVTEVTDLSDAQNKFGDPSELTRQVALAFANGAQTVYAVPVAETQTTETFSATTSGTLGNVPFDPNVQPEHTITAADDSGATITVNTVYEYPPPSPSEADTINLNPVTGEWAADASDTYDITYTYGNYSAAVTDSGVFNQEPRYVALLTEQESVAATDFLPKATQAAQDFRTFTRGFIGGEVGKSPSSYSDSLDDERVCAVATPRVESVNNNEIRAVGPIASVAAATQLGSSITYEGLQGVADVTPYFSPYNVDDAASFINDHQAIPLLNFGDVQIVKGITTAKKDKFGRLHKVEVVDEVTEGVYNAAENFISKPNTSAQREDLRGTIVSFLQGLTIGSPPLLSATDGSRPYSVTVSNIDDTTVRVAVGIDVTDVMEQFDVTINVGDVITNEGVA